MLFCRNAAYKYRQLLSSLSSLVNCSGGNCNPAFPLATAEKRSREGLSRQTGLRRRFPEGYHRRGWRQYALHVVGLKERLTEPVQSVVPFLKGDISPWRVTHGIGGGTAQGYKDGLLGFSACGLEGRTQVVTLGIIRLPMYCVE